MADLIVYEKSKIDSLLENKANLSDVYTSDEIDEKLTPVMPSTQASDTALAGAKSSAEFINSSINNFAAFYITKDAAGNAFETKLQLTSATKFYNAGQERVPTKNDYLVVLHDESKETESGIKPTTRYAYDGGQWAFQYIVNDTAFTASQLAAIDSGITSSKVTTYDGYASQIANKANSTHNHNISDVNGLTQVLANKQNKITVEGILKSDGNNISAASIEDFEGLVKHQNIDFKRDKQDLNTYSASYCDWILEGGIHLVSDGSGLQWYNSDRSAILSFDGNNERWILTYNGTYFSVQKIPNVLSLDFKNYTPGFQITYGVVKRNAIYNYTQNGTIAKISDVSTRFGSGSEIKNRTVHQCTVTNSEVVLSVEDPQDTTIARQFSLNVDSKHMTSGGKLTVNFPQGSVLYGDNITFQSGYKTFFEIQEIDHNAFLVRKTELQSKADYYVSTTGNDSNDGTSPSTAFATIQKAVSQAIDGEIITVLAGTYEINTEISINKQITICGDGLENTIIKQTVTNYTATGRCMTIDGGAKVEGFTLTNGQCTNEGAGAYIKNGTLSWCHITNNKVGSGGYKAGAGVSFTGGHGQIDHCIVSNNTLQSGWGGGIGAQNINATVLVDKCLVYGNTNVNSGGGIAFDTCTPDVTVRNCTIVRNTANTNTSGLYRNNGSGKITIINNIIAGNIFSNTENNTAINSGCIDLVNSKNCIIGNNVTTGGNVGYGDQNLLTDLASSGFICASLGSVVRSSSGDYHLKSSSPAKGAGITYSNIGVDLDKVEYSNPPSIGCYEWIVRPGPELGWTAKHMTTDISSICTDGTLVYAYARDNYTINASSPDAVPFTKDINSNNVEWNLSLTGSAQAGISTDTQYNGLLSDFWSLHDYPSVVTLKNLTVGHTYLVQIICCRKNAGSDHNVELYVSESDDPNTYIKCSGADWTYGGSLIGVFKPQSTQATFNLVKRSSSQDWMVFNGIQVRDVTNI